MLYEVITTADTANAVATSRTSAADGFADALSAARGRIATARGSDASSALGALFNEKVAARTEANASDAEPKTRTRGRADAARDAEDRTTRSRRRDDAKTETAKTADDRNNFV